MGPFYLVVFFCIFLFDSGWAFSFGVGFGVGSFLGKRSLLYYGWALCFCFVLFFIGVGLAEDGCFLRVGSKRA